MAAASNQEIKKTVEDKIKLWLILLNRFITERNPREKQMIIALGLSGIIFLDYWILINPVVKTYLQVNSKSVHLEAELKDLKDDQKNRKLIEKNWNQAKANLEMSEKRFIGANEMPTFLENLSKLALDSGVKVMSLQPFESPIQNAKKAPMDPYTGVPIRISAIAGTHEFGRFLSSLENNTPFIKVTDVKISSNPSDDRRHSLELNIEVYRKESAS